MFPPKTLPPSFSRIYSVAGKVFLLGEYLALVEKPCLVAALGPRFQWIQVQASSDPTTADPIHSFDPASPAGRLFEEFRTEFAAGMRSRFVDPFEGRGGFGASTAQFALVYLSIASQLGWDTRWPAVWKRYREISRSAQGLSPSGADLVAQWQGGIVFFDSSDHHCMDLWPIFDWSGLLVFSATHQAGRKVKTHEHLAELGKQGMLQPDSRLFAELEKPLTRGIIAIRERDAKDFGNALDDYAEILSVAGLEHSRTTEDRANLRDLPGVLGVKGTGAMQADGILVWVDPTRPDCKTAVIDRARHRDLILVADGLSSELGVACQNVES